MVSEVVYDTIGIHYTLKKGTGGGGGRGGYDTSLTREDRDTKGHR